MLETLGNPIRLDLARAGPELRGGVWEFLPSLGRVRRAGVQKEWRGNSAASLSCAADYSIFKEKQPVKRIDSVAVGLVAVLLVSAGAYFHNMGADDVQLAKPAEPTMDTPPPEPTPAVVKNEPTLAPMAFLPPPPRGQVIRVQVQVEQGDLRVHEN